VSILAGKYGLIVGVANKRVDFLGHRPRRRLRPARASR